MKFKKRKPTAEQVLREVQSTARHFATLTGKPTQAVRSADGMVRYQLENFPLSGDFLTIQVPEKVEKVAA